jgi:hypothetical protein
VTLDINGDAIDAANYLAHQFPDDPPCPLDTKEDRIAAVRDAIIDVLASEGPDAWAGSIEVEETVPPDSVPLVTQGNES